MNKKFWFTDEVLGSWTREKLRERDLEEEQPHRPTAEELAAAFKKNGVRPVARKWGAHIRDGRYSTLRGEGCAITAYMHGRGVSDCEPDSSVEDQLCRDFEALTGINAMEFVRGFDGNVCIFFTDDYELGRKVRQLVEPDESLSWKVTNYVYSIKLDDVFYEPDKIDGDKLADYMVVGVTPTAPVGAVTEPEKSWAIDEDNEEPLTQAVGVATKEP